MCNYKENEIEDVINALKENYSKEEIKEALECSYNRVKFEQKLYDDLFIDDSVTGNVSGSYTFNAYQAGLNLAGNYDLLREALEEFGGDYGEALERGEEYCDVTIRCYLLEQCISEALDELEEELCD